MINKYRIVETIEAFRVEKLVITYYKKWFKKYVKEEWIPLSCHGIMVVTVHNSYIPNSYYVIKWFDSLEDAKKFLDKVKAGSKIYNEEGIINEN